MSKKVAPSGKEILKNISDKRFKQATDSTQLSCIFRLNDSRKRLMSNEDLNTNQQRPEPTDQELAQASGGRGAKDLKQREEYERSCREARRKLNGST